MVRWVDVNQNSKLRLLLKMHNAEDKKSGSSEGGGGGGGVGGWM